MSRVSFLPGNLDRKSFNRYDKVANETEKGAEIVQNPSLEDILKDLGKWYDFDVRYAREDARLIPFSLNIKKHDAFAEVLQLLEDTGCVKFDIRDNVVVVK